MFPAELKGFIYKLTCSETDKVYIGQTLSHVYSKKDDRWNKSGINNRLELHFRDAVCYKDRPLYKDMLHYGFETFKIETIHEIPPERFNELDYLEHKEIKNFNSKVPNGYNITDNTITNNRTKKMVIEELDLETINPDYTPKSRKERRQQVVVRLEQRDTFFEDEIVEKINIAAIKNKGEISFIRVTVFVEDRDDIYRCDFTKSRGKAIKEAALDAIYFAEYIAYTNPEIININDNIKSLLEDKENYKYQDKITALNEFQINTVSSGIYHHKQTGSELYVLFFRGTEETKKVQFGGRKTTIEDAYNEASIFLDKLKVKHPEIKEIKLKPIKSCHQQQATTKVAKITFVD
jgi:hypothetical protein